MQRCGAAIIRVAVNCKNMDLKGLLVQECGKQCEEAVTEEIARL